MAYLLAPETAFQENTFDPGETLPTGITPVGSVIAGQGVGVGVGVGVLVGVGVFVGVGVAEGAKLPLAIILANLVPPE